MLQLVNIRLKRIDFLSIGIFAIAALFLFLYRIGVENIFSINSQLIAIFIIGVALLFCGYSSMKSVRQGVNTIHNSMFMISFFFSGVLLVIGAGFLMVFQR